MERIAAWARDHAVKIAVAFTGVLVAWALYGQQTNNTKIARLVKEQIVVKDMREYTDCISRQDARDAIRELVLLLEGSKFVDDSSKAIIEEVLGQLPAIKCEVKP